MGRACRARRSSRTTISTSRSVLCTVRGPSWSLVVTRGHSSVHSWSLVVALVFTRGHSWSLVFTRGRPWSLSRASPFGTVLDSFAASSLARMIVARTHRGGSRSRAARVLRGDRRVARRRVRRVGDERVPALGAARRRRARLLDAARHVARRAPHPELRRAGRRGGAQGASSQEARFAGRGQSQSHRPTGPAVTCCTRWERPGWHKHVHKRGEETNSAMQSRKHKTIVTRTRLGQQGRDTPGRRSFLSGVSHGTSHGASFLYPPPATP